MEPALTVSPVAVVLSKWKSLTPPGQDTNPSQVSSQQMLVLTYQLWRMESWVSLGRIEGHTKLMLKPQQSQELKWVPCGRKAEILPTAPTMLAQIFFTNKESHTAIDIKLNNYNSKNQIPQKKHFNCFIYNSCKYISAFLVYNTTWLGVSIDAGNWWISRTF